MLILKGQLNFRLQHNSVKSNAQLAKLMKAQL